LKKVSRRFLKGLEDSTLIVFVPQFLMGMRPVRIPSPGFESLASEEISGCRGHYGYLSLHYNINGHGQQSQGYCPKSAMSNCLRSKASRVMKAYHRGIFKHLVRFPSFGLARDLSYTPSGTVHSFVFFVLLTETLQHSRCACFCLWAIPTPFWKQN
jgi:hypothetical protein